MLVCRLLATTFTSTSSITEPTALQNLIFLHGNKAAGFRDFHQFHYCNFLCAHADAGVRAILGLIARAVTPSIPSNYHTFSLQALAYIFYIALKYWLMTVRSIPLCISLYVGSADDR